MGGGERGRCNSNVVRGVRPQCHGDEVDVSEQCGVSVMPDMVALSGTTTHNRCVHLVGEREIQGGRTANRLSVTGSNRALGQLAGNHHQSNHQSCYQSRYSQIISQ